MTILRRGCGTRGGHVGDSWSGLRLRIGGRVALDGGGGRSRWVPRLAGAMLVSALSVRDRYVRAND